MAEFTAGSKPQIITDLRAKVADIIGVSAEEIDTVEELYDQGLDSVRLVDIVNWLREQGYDVEFADFTEDTSLDAWQEILEELEEDAEEEASPEA